MITVQNGPDINPTMTIKVGDFLQFEKDAILESRCVGVLDKDGEVAYAMPLTRNDVKALIALLELLAS